jgi:hypothetical protein
VPTIFSKQYCKNASPTLIKDTYTHDFLICISCRMDEMMRGQRGWRELAALGDKITKFTGMIEGLIWSPRGGDCHEQPDDWAFEEVF